MFIRTKTGSAIQRYDEISKELLELLKKHTDEYFMPEIIEVIEELCQVEAFWFSLEDKNTKGCFFEYPYSVDNNVSYFYSLVHVEQVL